MSDHISKEMRVVRNKFPITLNLVYMNSASSGPLPVETREYINSKLDQYDEGFPPIDEVFETHNRARANCAQLINADAGEISLTYNTSLGLNTILSGLPVEGGCEVIIPEYEFPAVVYASYPLRKKGIEVRFIKSIYGQVTSEMLEDEIDEKTGILVLSWVSFYSGLVSDMRELSEFCKEKEIFLVVDATQGLGSISLDVKESGIDFLACGAQKWLCSPEGTGFIYISREMLNRVEPSYEGWLGVDRGDDFFKLTDYTYKKYADARRFYTGTVSELMFGAMSESLGLILSADVEKIESHITKLNTKLRERLSELGFEYIDSPDSRLSGITTILTADYERLGEILREEDIIVSSRDGYIRISPHFFNTEKEISFLLDILEKSI